MATHAQTASSQRSAPMMVGSGCHTLAAGMLGASSRKSPCAARSNADERRCQGASTTPKSVVAMATVIAV